MTPKFVLTAAHCFTFGDLPEHVTVEIDDGKGRGNVKCLFIHNPEVTSFYQFTKKCCILSKVIHFGFLFTFVVFKSKVNLMLYFILARLRSLSWVLKGFLSVILPNDGINCVLQ